jgi:hypothetical protein
MVTISARNFIRKVLSRAGLGVNHLAGSPGGQGPPDPARPYEPTLTSQPRGSAPEPGADRTRTVTGAAADVSPVPPPPLADPAARGGITGIVDHPQQVIRHGPGVPAPWQAGQAVPTAEQVWRTALPNAPRRPRRLRRLAGPALSVALLAASGVVIYLRLHHGPFGVTGVAITEQVKKGCTENVTGRVGTTGAAGTVSYQWVFEPRLAAPRPLSQSVAAGQSALYVTAAVEGQGHGSLTQTVILQVLSPGQVSASAQVVLSC